MKQHLVTTDAKHERFLRLLAKQEEKVVGFDTEAVGPARRYSQAKDKPFLNLGYTALQGFSIALQCGEVFYYPLRHKKQNAKWRWAEAAFAALENHVVWAHNVKFDSNLMEQEGFNIDHVAWMDSMLAAWLFYGRGNGIGLKPLALAILDRESPEWTGSLIDKSGADVLDYVCHDAINTLELGAYFKANLPAKQWNALVTIESPFAVELGRMERGGIRLDLEKLERTMGELAGKNLAASEKKWDAYAPDANPNSSKSLQELFTDGTWVPYGLTKDGKFKTGRDVMEYNEKNAKHKGGKEMATLCLEIRGARKVIGTYLEGFYEEMRQWPDRRLHPELMQTGTRTGRLSSSNPNIQNQLSKGEYAPLLKSCYIPEDGWSFVSADYAQIELRLFAELAGGSLLQAYLDGADLHQRTADAIKGSRDNGKTFNFGFLIYGGGPKKAAREFNWDMEQAKVNIAAVGSEYPEAAAFRTKVINACAARTPIPFVRTKTGRIRWVPELRSHEWRDRDPEAWGKKAKYLAGLYKINPTDIASLHRVIRSSGERIAVNTIIQGSAADIAKHAMVQFAANTDRDVMRLVTMVHDEVLATALDSAAKDCSVKLKMYMEQAGPALGYSVPILAEPAIGKTWDAVH